MLVESAAAHFIIDTTENMERVLHSMIDKLRKGITLHYLTEKDLKSFEIIFLYFH